MQQPPFELVANWRQPRRSASLSRRRCYCGRIRWSNSEPARVRRWPRSRPRRADRRRGV